MLPHARSPSAGGCPHVGRLLISSAAAARAQRRRLTARHSAQSRAVMRLKVP